MALFGPKDKSLPRLTTLYQVTPMNWGVDYGRTHDELRSDRQGLNQRYLGTELFTWIVREKKISDRPPINPEEWECFFRLARLRDVVHDIMDTLADSKQPDERDLTQLDGILRTIPSPQISSGLHWERKPSPVGTAYPEGRAYPNDPGPVWADEKSVSIVDWSSLDWDYGIGLNVIQELVREMHNPDQFQRCEECNSVFIASRAGQRYCSNRCSSRVRMRKARKKKDSDVALI